MSVFLAGGASLPTWWTDRRPLWRRALDARATQQERKRNKPGPKPKRHADPHVPQPR